MIGIRVLEILYNPKILIRRRKDTLEKNLAESRIDAREYTYIRPTFYPFLEEES